MNEAHTYAELALSSDGRLFLNEGVHCAECLPLDEFQKIQVHFSQGGDTGLLRFGLSDHPFLPQDFASGIHSYANFSPTIPPEDLDLTISQAALLLQISPQKLTQLLDAKTIPFTRLGKQRRIGFQAILNYRKQK